MGDMTASAYNALVAIDSVWVASLMVTSRTVLAVILRQLVTIFSCLKLCEAKLSSGSPNGSVFIQLWRPH